jgi:ABC-type multidrug transport system fused ATPase/permease subunit
MDEDARDSRKTPATWREYLKCGVQSMDVFRWTWALTPQDAKRRTKHLIISALVMIAMRLITPRFVSQLIDGASLQLVSATLVGFVGIMGMTFISRWFDYHFAQAREWILGLTWSALDAHISREFFAKSVGQHVHEARRLAVHVIDKGRWRTLELQAMMLFDGIPAIFSLLLSYVLLLLYIPVAAVIMTAGIVAHLAISLYLNMRVMVVCSPLDAEFRAYNRRLIEGWKKVERVKVSGRGVEDVLRSTAQLDDILVRDRVFWLWYIGRSVSRGMASRGCAMIALAYGAWLVWTHQASPSSLLPLFMWTSELAENMWQISKLEHKLNWNAPAVQFMIDSIAITPDVVSGSTLIDPTKPITVLVSSVGYLYPGSGDTVLRDANFMIGPGEKVALLGPSGAGKTTIMRLVLRHSDPTEGRIFVQGSDLRAIHLESWWRVVGYIPQQPQIFDGTIRDNLVYGLPPDERARITDEELWEYMRLLQIDFGSRLTQGLDTVVGESGLKLSGGQAQRLMIGAAAVKKPRFMVIDEATSSLDSTTEKLVQHGLRKILTPEVGALVVAHRLSTVRTLCDRFVILRQSNGDGECVPQVEAVASSFEELYDISPTFRQLADDQEIAIGEEKVHRMPMTQAV